MSLRNLSLLSLLLVAACSDSSSEVDLDAAAPDAFVEIADAGPPDAFVPPTDKLDVLLVIDSSVSMAGAKRHFSDSLPALVDQLKAQAPATLSLHLGVISTDVFIPTGAGGPACNGGDGSLISGQACLTDGVFLRDEPGDAPGNYAGTLGDAAKCLSNASSYGCGFEQPLESVRLAMAPDQQTNLGFLRDDAAMLVVILSNEDDCSASSDEIFRMDNTGTLGPLQSFRCTRFDVKCEGKEVNAVGTYTDCAADPEPTYLKRLSDFRDSLVARKGSTQRIAFVTVTGKADPFALKLEDRNGDSFLVLDASCTGLDFTATPALRLTTLAAMFPLHHSAVLCDDLTASMQTAADLALAAMK
jgi:hypothetical protein